MERSPQITFRGLSPSPAVQARVLEKIAELEHFYDRLIGCYVVIDIPERHSHKGNLFEIRIELSVPGAEPIIVSHRHHDKQQHEDIYVAIRDAFASARRRLQDHARKQRGDVKSHQASSHGFIWHLVPEQRYGFIMSSDHIEIYFHEHALVGVEFDELEVGTEVVFVSHDNEGVEGPQASTVRLDGDHLLPPSTPPRLT